MDVNWNTAIGRCNARVEELRAEFGGVLAERIVEAEAAEFMWESRVRERYFGQHFGADLVGDEASVELSRVTILSLLAGAWHVGMCVVDGEGAVVELVWKRAFDSRDEAEIAFSRAR